MVGSGRGKTEASREVEKSGELDLEMSGVGEGSRDTQGGGVSHRT